MSFWILWRPPFLLTTSVASPFRESASAVKIRFFDIYCDIHSNMSSHDTSICAWRHSYYFMICPPSSCDTLLCVLTTCQLFPSWSVILKKVLFDTTMLTSLKRDCSCRCNKLLFLNTFSYPCFSEDSHINHDLWYPVGHLCQCSGGLPLPLGSFIVQLFKLNTL